MAKRSGGGKGGKGAIEDDDPEKFVRIWQMKNTIKRFSTARGHGTSVISIIVPKGDQISRMLQKLTDEHGTATNIKSRVNRLSVLAAIECAKQKLKKYSRTPPNGLVVFCGEVITTEGKQKMLREAFEPFKPISTSLYWCGDRFRTEALEELLQTDETYGFIVMDGHGCLFGTLSGSTCTVLQKFSVELPKKHGRGGQSSARFGRLRMEKRQNYVRKCAEAAYTHFLPGHERPNVQGLVLAGCASFKLDLQESDVFDKRLKEIVLKVVDTSYGGEIGFNQAIELSREALSDVKFVREKELLQRFMEEIARDQNMYCFGVRDTMRAFDMGALDTLIVYEALDMQYFLLTKPKDKSDSDDTPPETRVEIIPTDQLGEIDIFTDDDGVKWERTEQNDYLDWLSKNYHSQRVKLEFVTDRSAEGNQFVRGFGGVGGLLRYAVDFAELDGLIEQGDSDFDSDEYI